MNGYHPTLSAAVGEAQLRDMLRAAEMSRLAAELPRTRHQRTPLWRPGWWQRATAGMAVRRPAARRPAVAMNA